MRRDGEVAGLSSHVHRPSCAMRPGTRWPIPTMPRRRSSTTRATGTRRTRHDFARSHCGRIRGLAEAWRSPTGIKPVAVLFDPFAGSESGTRPARSAAIASGFASVRSFPSERSTSPQASCRFRSRPRQRSLCSCPHQSTTWRSQREGWDFDPPALHHFINKPYLAPPPAAQPHALRTRTRQPSKVSIARA